MTQSEYLAILFNDCGFTTKQAHGYIQNWFPSARDASDLTNDQRSFIIMKLNAKKAEQRES